MSRRSNDAIPMKARPAPADFIRFLKKVEIDLETGCWIWMAHKSKKGYGQFKFQGRAHWAHRWSKQAWHGAFEGPDQGHHECFNPSCVNPDHIGGLTRSENTILG